MTWYFFRKTNQLKNKKDNNEINGGQFKQHLQHTLDILSEYAIVVEKYSSENQFYMPESKLPHDKETVKYAIFTWHSLLSHIENREKIKKTSFGDTDYILSDKFYNWLETGYVLLAQFIPDMQAIFCSNYLNKVISFEGESSKSELNHKSRLYEKISKKVSMNRKAYLQEIKENRSKFKNSNV